MNPETSSTGDQVLPIPVGEYGLAPGYSLMRILIGFGAGAGCLLLALFGLPVDSLVEETVIRTIGAVGGLLYPLYSLGLLRRLRGEPRLRISRDGIHIIPDFGLSPLIGFFRAPFMRTPEEEFIPWSAFRSFEPGPGPISSVIVEYDGYQVPRWRRFLPKGRQFASGRQVSLGDLKVSGKALRDRLTSWSRERQALAIRSAARRLQGEGEMQSQLGRPGMENGPHESAERGVGGGEGSPTLERLHDMPS